MKPVKSQETESVKLRTPPAWLAQAQKAFARGPLGKLSDKEIGQLCEEIAEKAAKKHTRDTVPG